MHSPNIGNFFPASSPSNPFKNFIFLCFNVLCKSSFLCCKTILNHKHCWIFFCQPLLLKKFYLHSYLHFPDIHLLLHYLVLYLPFNLKQVFLQSYKALDFALSPIFPSPYTLSFTYKIICTSRNLLHLYNFQSWQTIKGLKAPLVSLSPNVAQFAKQFQEFV